jgi:hypothetical protein
MIQFNFEEVRSLSQQQEDKEYFIRELGPLKEEFEEGESVVTFFNYVNGKRKISYNMAKADIGAFIHKWQQWQQLQKLP